MARSLDVRMSSPNQHRINEPTTANPAPTPQRIIVREIGIGNPAGDKPYVYLEPDKHHPYNGQASLDAILLGLINGNYNQQGPVDQYYRPLDLNLSYPSIIVFWLNAEPSWRFSHKSYGATLGEFDVPSERNNYFSLRHVLLDPSGSESYFNDHTKRCRIIYFTAKPPNRSFFHPFNLNVEYLFNDVNGDSKPNTLPVVIDPDIRNPGGSES